VIPQEEILALRGEWRLREDVIEKDYVLGWMLAAIAAQPELVDTWIFKGGTCLRKCYFETYRFSEDLDFTIVNGGPEDPVELDDIFTRVRAWLQDNCGLEVVCDDRAFVRRKNRRGNPTTRGRVAYRGPRMPPTLPKIKLDLTSDEAFVEPIARPRIFHPYTDTLAGSARIGSYSIVELLAEKIRALSERCRPRDLYDVVNIHRHPNLFDSPGAVLNALRIKCDYVNIPVPTAESIRRSPFRDELDREWENMLAHQLPHLPPVEDYWDAMDSVFEWLLGAAVVSLPRAERPGLDPSWSAPAGMVSWRGGTPLEIIRFAGANRLKVEIDYRASQGRQGSRSVEPYSLRRTRDGELLLFVVNDRGQLRSYRVDRISDVRVSSETFVPQYNVEF